MRRKQVCVTLAIPEIAPSRIYLIKRMDNVKTTQTCKKWKVQIYSIYLRNGKCIYIHAIQKCVFYIWSLNIFRLCHHRERDCYHRWFHKHDIEIHTYNQNVFWRNSHNGLEDNPDMYIRGCSVMLLTAQPTVTGVGDSL